MLENPALQPQALRKKHVNFSTYQIINFFISVINIIVLHWCIFRIIKREEFPHIRTKIKQFSTEIITEFCKQVSAMISGYDSNYTIYDPKLHIKRIWTGILFAYLLELLYLLANGKILLWDLGLQKHMHTDDKKFSVVDTFIKTRDRKSFLLFDNVRHWQ